MPRNGIITTRSIVHSEIAVELRATLIVLITFIYN
jgi:hypothetical protein